MVWVVNATPRPLYPRERPVTHCIGGWPGPRAGLDGCGKFRPPPGFDPRTTQPIAQSLYRLRYPAEAQLVEGLHYMPEVRGFYSRWCHCNLSLTQSFRSHYGPGVDSFSNRNEYQQYFLGGGGGKCCQYVGLTTLPPSCADFLETWEPELPGTLRACPGL
jgi:hypothetical protein